jgi:hypothetical protein
MEQYPEIPGSRKAPLGKPCIAFVKYDGSNLRWEWSPKRGWHKFGTRTELFSPNHPLWGQAIPLFEPIADDIARRVKESDWRFRGIQRITAFTEFFGPSSFAGTHAEAEPKELRLFDVYLFKKGIMPPRWFADTFGDAPYAAQVVYQGNLSREFIDDVHGGKYPVWEGVVAKGEDFMVKIKTEAYMRKLKEVYGLKWERFAE